MSSEHKVVFVTGLSDDVSKITWATRNWYKLGLIPVVHAFGWRQTETDFEHKLARLNSLIDDLSAQNDLISLVGTSAGGSAVVNAYCERRKIIHRLVNVCGRLKTGSQTGFRSLAARSASSPSFAQSVKLCESNLRTFKATDYKKVMTMRPLWDELVPAETVTVSGAKNILMPTIEHLLSISAALTIFTNPLIEFLND